VPRDRWLILKTAKARMVGLRPFLAMISGDKRRAPGVGLPSLGHRPERTDARYARLDLRHSDKSCIELAGLDSRKEEPRLTSAPGLVVRTAYRVPERAGCSPAQVSLAACRRPGDYPKMGRVSANRHASLSCPSE
jgi:hypothetical protein